MVARRAFVASAAGIVLTAAPFARAQRPRKLRLGMLVASLDRSGRVLDAFLQALRELGYVEGDNLVILRRDVEGRQERFPALAAELVALAPDVILASSTPAARAVKQATGTIPILFVGDPDPVASGLVASLAHPGGNVTGISQLGNELLGKRLELLKTVVPSVRRVGYLWQRDVFPAQVEADMLKRAETEAQTLGLQVAFAETRPDDLDRAFAALVAARADALLLHNASPTLFAERRRIAALAISHRLPSVGQVREFVVDGGLMSYGANFAASYRRVATFIDRIARGAKPADLAVERATTVELAVNVKTAATLGITFTPAFLARADLVER